MVLLRVIKRPKRRPVFNDYMTFDIETVDPKGVSDLLGETVYISWCTGGVGYGAASVDLTGWLLTYFLIPERDNWILYAHNAFGFDLKRVTFRKLAEHGFDAKFLTAKGGQIKAVTLKRRGYTWFIRDTSLLFPMKLGEVTKTFAKAHMKLKRDSFEYRSFDINNQADIDYAIQDSVGLYYALQNVDEIMMEEFDVSIHDAPTLPGLAFRAFRLTLRAEDEENMIPEEVYPGIGWDVAHAARESYHGGMTLALNTEVHYDEVSIDNNSMYGYVMLHFPLPTGSVRKYVSPPPHSTVHNTLCLAACFVPDNCFPFLKTKEESGRVGNFKGFQVGWYWLSELELQRELGGTYEIIECYVWEETTDVAQRFVTKCRNLRMKDYYGPIGTVAKLFQNSCYGKFAQQTPEMELVMSLTEPPDAFPAYHVETDQILSHLWYIKSRPNFSADMVHWASFITAKARETLMRGMMQIGIEHVDYVDTDSIFFERRYMDSALSLLGEDYGQFKLEKEMTEFQAIAPKAYRRQEFNKKKNRLERVVNNKGVPKKAVSTTLYYKRIGRENTSVSFIMSHNLRQLLENPSKGYGKETSRRLATENSTTNGKISARTWQPTTCISRDIGVIMGRNLSLPQRSRVERQLELFQTKFDSVQRV